MTDSIKGLEMMAKLSEQMVQAAGSGDWDRLVELERQMKGVRDSLPSIDRTSMDDATLLHKARLLEGMLKNQKVVMQHVRPWMDRTRKNLADSARDRAVRAAYGTPRF